MSITITDPAALAQFEQAAGVVEVMHPDGRVLGRFMVEGVGQAAARGQFPVHG